MTAAWWTHYPDLLDENTMRDGRKLLPENTNAPVGADFHGYTFLFPTQPAADDGAIRAICKRYFARPEA